MSWTDKQAVRVICKLRDLYGIEDFVETGTFKGINALTQSRNFKRVLTCEKQDKYFQIAKEKCANRTNVTVYPYDSSSFLWRYRAHRDITQNKSIPFFYLDAHFYDPEHKWVVKDELAALKRFGDCVIAIHDFDTGNPEMGHITYDGQPLDFFITQKLEQVGCLYYYVNTPNGCDIMEEDETDDPDAKDNLRYAHSKPDNGKRGILYAVPTKLKDTFGLVEYEIKS